MSIFQGPVGFSFIDFVRSVLFLETTPRMVAPFCGKHRRALVLADVVNCFSRTLQHCRPVFRGAATAQRRSTALLSPLNHTGLRLPCIRASSDPVKAVALGPVPPNSARLPLHSNGPKGTGSPKTKNPGFSQTDHGTSQPVTR